MDAVIDRAGASGSDTVQAPSPADQFTAGLPHAVAAMIAGPAVAGILLASSGVSSVYFLDFLTYFVSLVAVFLIKTPVLLEKNGEPILRSIFQGIRYAVSRKVHDAIL